ncbi:MAG TPA: IclR family transcriptional regulator [Bryobacteraceae bacterium]
MAVGNSGKSLVPALERGFAILEVLGRSRAGLTLSQLTRSLSLPKSSVHCLLRTLHASGYLYKDSVSAKYRISLKVCELARQALNGTGIREIARRDLKKLSDGTGLTVHLGIIEQSSCVLIEKLTPVGGPRTSTWVGKQLGLHCTAIGKALIARVPSDEAMRLIANQGLIRYNDNTIVSLRQLNSELEKIRNQGYSLDDEEEEIGVRCIGRAIANASGEAVAALSITGTVNQINSERVRLLANTVIDTANRIERQMKGHNLDLGCALPVSEFGTMRPGSLALDRDEADSSPADHDRRCPQPLFPRSGSLHA